MNDNNLGKLYFTHDVLPNRSMLTSIEIRKESGHSFFLGNSISVKKTDVDKIGGTFYTTKLKAVQDEIRKCLKKKKGHIISLGIIKSKLEQLQSIEDKLTPEKQ